MLFGGFAFPAGGVIPEHYAHLLEGMVGIMLVVLGLDVLRQLYRRRIHFHAHSHGDGLVHFHAHSHAPGEPHDGRAHRHEHPAHLPRRALVVGLMHGMAGSAALVILTAESTQGPLTGLLYILLFGLGSVLGMAALSVIIMLPMRRLRATGLTRTYAMLQLVLAALTIGLGAQIVWDNLSLLS